MSDRPLIAHIIYSLSTGGLENGLVNIINRCPPGRYRHVIICLTKADEFASRITADGVDVIEMHKREGHDFDCYLRLWRLLRKLRPAIVHSRNLAALEAQWCTLGLRRVRRVHGEHGREITDLDGTNWKYLTFRKLMRLMIHRYIAVSEDLQQWLLRSVGARPERVFQVYNGVDHERFKPGTVKPLALLPAHWQKHDGIVIIGTVGRLTPVKDQQLLLRSLAHLREQYTEFAAGLRLLIVGDGPLEAELYSLVQQLQLSDVVWMAGDRSDVPQLLSAMDLFVLPSLAEGISNTVLEAMASGLPVVATAAGGNVELVEDDFNGALFPVGDHLALAHTLMTILSDKQKLARLGTNAHERVAARFDWDNTVSQYLNVYDTLIDQRVAAAD